MKQEIVNGLVIIFNKSFEEGRFPEMLKIAKVIPIFKGKNAADPKVCFKSFVTLIIKLYNFSNI